MLDELKNFFQNFGIELDDKDWSLLTKSLVWKSYTKSEVILRSTEVCTQSTFLVDGILRIYNHHEGREYTRNIFTKGDFFAESTSFFTGKSHGFLIDCIEPASAFVLSKDKLEYIRKESTVLSKFFSKQLERALVFMILKIGEQQLSGIGRYNKLRKERPHLFGRVPNYMLSSFLNMTPEAFSRIQNKK